MRIAIHTYPSFQKYALFSLPESMMRANNKKFNLKKVFNRLFLFISLGIFAHLIFLLITTDKEILFQVSDIHLRYLFFIAVLVMIPWICHAARMYMWTRFLNTGITYGQALKSAVVSDLGAAITPTLIGGGPIKVGMLINYKVPPAKAGIILGLGTLEDIIFYSSGFALASFLVRDSILSIVDAVFALFFRYWYIAGALILAILLFIWLRKSGKILWNLSVFDRLPKKFKRGILKFLIAFRKTFKEAGQTLKFILKHGKLRFLLSFFLLLIQWASKFSILAVILYALDIQMDMISIYIKQWLVWLTMIFIPTPGATGGAEASFFLLFGANIPTRVLTLVVSVWRFFTYYFIMLSAIIVYQCVTYLSTFKLTTQKSVY